MTAKVRIGIIGCGSVAQVAHLPAIRHSDRLVLTALRSRHRSTAERVAQEWGPAKVYDTAEELVAADDVDAVIVASPNAFHYDHARLALAAGRHVYIEKPMTSTNRQAWELVAMARERNLKVTVGCHHRFWTQHRWARGMIEDGVVGDVHLVRSSLHETWRLYQEHVATSDYRMRPAEAVAGTLFDQGSHRIDLISYLVGARPRRVVGIARNVANPALGPGIDDLTVAMIEYANGAIGILTTDKFSPVVSNITEVYGDAGTMFASSDAINPFQSVPLAVYSARDFSWSTLPEPLKSFRYPTDFWVDDLIRERLAPRWTSIVPRRVRPFEAIQGDFAGAILEDRDPDLTAEDGAWAMEVLTGILRSMETGGWVDLPMSVEQVPPALRRDTDLAFHGVHDAG
jgi:predicted dehydrogenase